MKKKFFAFLLGIMGLVTISYSQNVNNPPPFGLGGILVSSTGATGTFVQVTAGTSTALPNTLPAGVVISYMGNLFGIVSVAAPVPGGNPNSPIAIMAGNINSAFNSYFVNGTINGQSVVIGGFGGQGVVVPVPFDLSTVSILAAGAFIAFATARRRRKEQGIIA